MARSSPDFLISTIIPAFNAENYLAEAIESVLTQTFPPVEVIVVDDGSTDRTAEIAEGFGGLVTCQRRAHAGIAATRNFGVEAAQGNWLAFLDADDCWLPEKLARQAAAARADAALQIIFGGTEQFVSPELDAAAQARLAPPALLTAGPHVGSMLVRREVFSHVGLFDPALKIFEFIDWYARARDLEVRMATVPEAVLRRRRHLGNTMVREKNSLAGMAAVLKRSLDRRRQSDTPP